MKKKENKIKKLQVPEFDSPTKASVFVPKKNKNIYLMSHLSGWSAPPVPPFGKGSKSKYQISKKIKHKNKITKMGEELPILKGILKGNVNYHNARKSPLFSLQRDPERSLPRLESERVDPISPPTDTDFGLKRQLKNNTHLLNS